jgi:hypothetical protein
MYLPVSRLFWVSSLAYPNLLGTKGYVDVVAVVVVQWLDENWFFYKEIWLQLGHSTMASKENDNKKIKITEQICCHGYILTTKLYLIS